MFTLKQEDANYEISNLQNIADVQFNPVRSISEISSCFFGPRPWHIEIRHRVKKTSTINLLGFETLKLSSKIEVMETDRNRQLANYCEMLYQRISIYIYIYIDIHMYT